MVRAIRIIKWNQPHSRLLLNKNKIPTTTTTKIISNTNNNH